MRFTICSIGVTAMTSQPIYVYKPSWLANTFIAQAREDAVRDVDPLKIQKLVYCLHGWHLAITGCPVTGERFEAWPNGPVLSTLYQKFKKYRWGQIRDYATDIDPQTGEERELIVARSDESFHAIFEIVWDKYKHLSGKQLSALTHAPGTPWSHAREAGRQYIDDREIQEHFISLAQAG